MEQKYELIMVDGRMLDRLSAAHAAVAPFQIDGWLAEVEDAMNPDNRVGQGVKDPNDTMRDGVIGDVYRVRFFRSETGLRVVGIRAPSLSWGATHTSGGWDAWCEALGLNAWGDTYAELNEVIIEAIDLWIRSHIDHGTLDEEMGKIGWTMLDEIPADLHERSQIIFDVPYQIVRLQG
jgi:predicted RNase H-like HicB family nuclease